MKLTNEEKREIAELYRDKSNKVETIARKFNIARGTVTSIAVSMGCERRQIKGKWKKGQKKTCTKCRRRIDLKGVKYCPFCGEDLRSEKDLLISRVERLLTSVMTIPNSGERDKARDTILATLNYLEKDGR
jgi:hypothetical protein